MIIYECCEYPPTPPRGRAPEKQGCCEFGRFPVAHSLTFFLIFPILKHSLGDVWHPGSGVPCFAGFAFLRWRLAQPLGAHSLTFFLIPYLPYLTAFLRWRLASWLWGSLFRRIWGFRSIWGLRVSLSSLSSLSLFRRIWGVSQPLEAHSLTFFLIFPISMHSLGDVWHPGSGVPCFGGFGGVRSLWGLTVSLSSLSSYLNAFLRWRLASWLWGSLFRRIWGFRSLWGLTVSLSSLSSLS